MDRLGLQPGGLAEAFGGAAGGRAQQHAHALGAQGLEDTGDNGGLAHARAARDDRDFAGEHLGHGGALRGGQRAARLLLDPGDGFRGIDGAPGRRALQQVQELRGDAHLGAVQRRQQQAGLAVDGLGDEAFLLDFQGDRLRNDGLGDLQERRGGLDELGLDDGAVALVGKRLQHMPHAGLGTDHGIAGNAQALRQGVGGLEADAVDVQGQAVGILLHPGDGLGAVGLVDAHGPGRAHAMAVQKHHDLAHDFLLGPGRDHTGGALGADAVEFLQALRGLRDDVEHLGAEGLHQFAGKVRADAFDHARTPNTARCPPAWWGARRAAASS